MLRVQSDGSVPSRWSRTGGRADGQFCVSRHSRNVPATFQLRLLVNEGEICRETRATRRQSNCCQWPGLCGRRTRSGRGSCGWAYSATGAAPAAYSGSACRAAPAAYSGSAAPAAYSGRAGRTDAAAYSASAGAAAYSGSAGHPAPTAAASRPADSATVSGVD